MRLIPACSMVVMACAGSPGSGDDDGGNHGSVVSIDVAPATARIPLAEAAGGYAAAQVYVVTATYQDGETADVTAQASWSADDSDAVTFDYSAATVTVIAAGHYQIAANVAGIQGNATIDATLDAAVLGDGFDAADTAKLDGTVDPSLTSTIEYPLDGSLFPVNVAPITVQLHKSSSTQSLARIDFTSSDLLSYRYYAPCQPSPNPAVTDACVISIGGAFATQLAGVSETADVQLAVRLVAADGSKLGAATPIALAWAKTKLTGGLYYWTTAGTGDTTFNTAVARYDFAGDTSTPTIFLSSANAPAVPSGQSQCIGCHAVSPDGTKMSFSLGGSLTGYFSEYDVATNTAVSTQMTDKFAGMSTFSPDASHLVTMSYGALTLRGSEAPLAAVTTPLFGEVSENKSHPFWSPSGLKMAFVSWTPSAQDVSSSHVTGDMVQGAQVWIADSNGADQFDTAHLLVPRADGVTSYYPAISDDDNFLVFNQSSCSGPANTGSWGTGACDGYNDISATLHVVPTAGGQPVALTRANGGDNPETTNSWPRWSPDHGTFRGKRLYWIAFSSRRSYGLSLASGAHKDTAKPQLWFAAVALDSTGAAPTSDPSFAPVWLPGQDPSFVGPRGNHTPAWTSKVVVLE